MARIVNPAHAHEPAANLGQALERAGLLKGAPVGAAGHERERHVQAAARDQQRVARPPRRRRRPVPVQRPLEPRAPPLARVHRQLVVPQPRRARPRLRRHHPRDRLRHAGPRRHDVVVRQRRQAGGAPGCERVRRRVGPGVRRRLGVEVAAQEGGHALRRVGPFRGRGRARVVPLVVLARRRERGQLALDVVAGNAGC